MPKRPLLQLAVKRFPDLTEPELHLVECVATGMVWSCLEEDQVKNNPTNAHLWGAEHTLRSDLIVWLCMDEDALEHVAYDGILIFGGHIKGTLNLNNSKFSKSILMAYCNISGNFECNKASFKLLNLSGTHVHDLIAAHLKVKGHVILGLGFTSKGLVDITDAHIGGSLSCVGGSFLNDNGSSLSAERLLVEESVYLRGRFHAKGSVQLAGAKIWGNLECHLDENLDIENVKIDGRCIF